MKIRGFIIAGILLSAVGGGLTGYAATREDFNFEELSHAEVELEEISYSTEEISSIFLTAAADNVKIVESDTEEIRIIGKKAEYMQYIYTLDEPTKSLTIEQEYEKNWFFRIFSFNPFWWNQELKTPYTIFIPKTGLKSMELTVNAGNAEIEQQNIERFSAHLNAGNLVIRNSSFIEIGLEVNAGNCSAENIATATLTAKVNAGNAEILSRITTFAKVDVNAGNAVLELIGDAEEYCINGKGNGSASIEVNVDLGNFRYSFKE